MMDKLCIWIDERILEPLGVASTQRGYNAGPCFLARLRLCRNLYRGVSTL
jgi:hypothetical protein